MSVSRTIPEGHDYPDNCDFTVIENPRFYRSEATTSDICNFIEDMARELCGAAMNAKQELLAFLLSAAAAEAHRQAGGPRLRRRPD